MTLIICEDILDASSWHEHEVDDLCAFIKSQYTVWPQTARIYHNEVSQQTDVTPFDETSVERLGNLTGKFYLIIYPELPVWAITLIIAIAVSAVAVGIGFLLRPHASPNVKNQQQQSPNNTAADRENQQRPNERIPDIYGTVMSTPDLLSVPYTVFDSSNNQIEYNYMCFGRGSYTVSNLRDDLTPIADIDGASAEVYAPYSSPNSGTSPQLRIGTAIATTVKTVQPSTAVNGQPLIAPNLSGGGAWVGPFFLGDPTTTEIMLNFVGQSGCYDVDGTTGDQSSVTVTIEVGITPSDASGAPIGAEVTHNVTVVGSSSLKTIVGTTDVSTVGGFSMVRCRRTSNTNISANVSVSDEIIWRDAYAVSPISATEFGNITTLQTKTIVTPDATAPTVRKYNAIVTRNIPVGTLSGGVVTFSTPGPTRVAADIIVAMATDTYIGNRTLAELDLVGIYTMMSTISTYFGTNLCTEFCYTFDDSKVSFEESLADIATAIFCTAYRRGNIISLAFEEKTSNSTIIFNHRNKIPRSETRTVTFGVQNDLNGIELTYTEPNDPDYPNVDTPTILYFPADMSGTNPKRITSIGVRNNVQAHILGSRLYNKLINQNTTSKFKCTLEAALCVINDRILNADNTRPDTNDGEVNAQNGLLITLSQPVPFIATYVYTIFLQLPDGTTESIAITPSGSITPNPEPYWDATVAYNIGKIANYQGTNYYCVLAHTNQLPTNTIYWQPVTYTRQVLLASAPSIGLVYDPCMYAKTTYIIVYNATHPTSAMLLQQKTPDTATTYEITAINYSDKYYTNDQDFVTGAITWNGDSGEVSSPIAPGGTYRPTAYNDIGTCATTSPSDNSGNVNGNLTIVGSSPPQPVRTYGDIIWSGFAPVRLTGASTLYIVISGFTSGSVCQININGIPTPVTLTPGTVGTYSTGIAALTYLSRVTIEVSVQSPGSPGTDTVSINDIYIT